MLGLLRCKHPFQSLAVEKQHTKEIKDSDFEYVDYHLLCRKCGEKLVLKHARLIDGVDGFLRRAETVSKLINERV